MDPILYIIAIAFIMIPFFYSDIHHLDIMPLFFLYFDATSIFVKHYPSYQYLEYSLVLIISLIYIFGQNSGRKLRGFGVFTFLLLVGLGIPIFQGVSLDPVLRNFSYTFAAMIMLPLGFDHYSKTGNIDKLLFFTFLFIVGNVLFVLFASPQRLGGFTSERFLGTTFYFGYVGIRGGVTTMGFVMLLTPLVFKVLKKYWQRIVFLMALGFVLVLFFFVLKRFVFLILGLGLLNYIFRKGLGRKYKIYLIGFFTLLSAIFFFDIGLQKSIEIRYEERGGENKFSEEVIATDLRIYEPLYVLKDTFNKTIDKVLIGESKRPVIDIKHGGYLIKEREIHNTYAGLIFTRGILGTFFYILIYVSLYRFAKKTYSKLKMRSKKFQNYWIVFQNLVLIFVLQGMVGGHSHITLRGLVFLYAGAIAGYFFHAFNKQRKYLIAQTYQK